MDPLFAMLTDTAVINDIRIGDRSVDVTGYIDQLQVPITVGTTSRTVITKFVINNGEGRRIQCVAWGRQAAFRASALIRIRMIVKIEGGIAKSPRYDSQGNVPLELRIEEHTMMTDLGEYPMETISENIVEENPLVPLVELNEVANASGRIRVRAFLKSAFRIITGNLSSYSLGVITDGFFKLEVQRATCTPLDIELGEPVEVTGTVYEDPTLHLQLRDNGEILKRTDDERLTLEDMKDISKVPQKTCKRARLE